MEVLVSIILDALRTKKENQEGKLQLGKELLKSSTSPLIEEEPKRKRRLLILGSGLIVSVAFALTFYFINVTRRDKQQAVVLPQEESVPLPGSVAALPVAAEHSGSVLTQARRLYTEGNYDESLKYFEKALESNNTDALVHNDLGMVYLKKELFSSASRHFERALELNSSCAVCFNNFGYLKTLLHEDAEAESYLRKALTLDPQQADPHFNLAVLYENNGDMGKAASEYRSFLQVSLRDDPLARQVRERVRTLTGQ